MGKDADLIGAVTQSNRTGTNTHRIAMLTRCGDEELELLRILFHFDSNHHCIRVREGSKNICFAHCVVVSVLGHNFNNFLRNRFVSELMF